MCWVFYFSVVGNQYKAYVYMCITTSLNIYLSSVRITSVSLGSDIFWLDLCKYDFAWHLTIFTSAPLSPLKSHPPSFHLDRGFFFFLLTLYFVLEYSQLTML